MTYCQLFINIKVINKYKIYLSVYLFAKLLMERSIRKTVLSRLSLDLYFTLCYSLLYLVETVELHLFYKEFVFKFFT